MTDNVMATFMAPLDGDDLSTRAVIHERQTIPCARCYSQQTDYRPQPNPLCRHCRGLGERVVVGVPVSPERYEPTSRFRERLEICKAVHLFGQGCEFCEGNARFTYIDRPPPSEYMESRHDNIYRTYFLASNAGLVLARHNFAQIDAIISELALPAGDDWMTHHYRQRLAAEVRHDDPDERMKASSSKWSKHPLFPGWVAVSRSGIAVRVHQWIFEPAQYRAIDEAIEAGRYDTVIESAAHEFWRAYERASQIVGWPFDWTPGATHRS